MGAAPSSSEVIPTTTPVTTVAFNWDQLPMDIMQEILKKLNGKDLLRFAAVSHRLRTLVNNESMFVLL